MIHEEFAVAETPLARGTTLIEASAGTGKTYTIAGLFLRLIVEENLRVGQILVTTYTVPATAELRDRIRRLLRAALDAWTLGASDDPLLRDLLAAGRVPADVAHRRLDAALRAFDESSIYTIHGFCHRILQDRAFESSLLFDAELISDQSALLQEIAEDYWRLRFYEAPSHEVAAALSGKLQPAKFARLLKETTSHSRLQILPQDADLAGAKLELESLFNELRERWSAWRDEVRALFLPMADWAKGDCAKPDVIEPQLDLVDCCAQAGALPSEFFDALATFSVSSIASCTKAKRSTPQHFFFDLCEVVIAATRRFNVAGETDFLAWARVELPLRKARRNVVSFDDLLTRLHAALHAPGGGRLAALVRARFPAALIDEFQDTDPVQAEIFTHIFSTPENWLYLIGDPKQAIYGFRGADVFSYLTAAARTLRQFKLGTNFRSASALVTAVNTIFSRSARPFLIDGIDFNPVHPAAQADAMPLQVHGQTRPPFRIWLSDSDDAFTASKVAEQLPRIVAAKITRLLDGRVQLGGRPLQPSDIAVLTASNQQARAVQAALSAQAVPSVLLSNASVFDSPEALEVQTLLAAVAEPLREGLLRAALATRLLAHTAFEIDALARNERDWETWLLRFQGWNERWRCQGFIPMFRRVLIDCCIRPRMLGQPDGERALTNVLQLAEILHRAACEERLSPSGLVHWLAARRRENVVADAEHELRLERDEDAVKVVTIHKSKGLEYNVVVCPFSWGKAELRKGERPLFHGDDGLALDLGSDQHEAHEALAGAERLAEHLRLLYVALTRARHECHFVWGRFAKNEVSAAAWLLHPPTNGGDPVAALQAHGAGLTAATLRAEIQSLAASAPDAIAAVLPWPDDTAPVYRSPQVHAQVPQARDFRGAIERDWRVSSFTSLTAHRESELPDYDRAPGSNDLPDTVFAPSGIHAFPAGMTPGVCLHSTFEKLDFTESARVPALVEQKLNAFGFNAAEWGGPVAQCVRDVIEVELAPGLKLAHVPWSARLQEVEFHLPVGHLDAASLAAVVGDGRLAFEPRRGLLKGFIDLVFEHAGRFYIVDWKSNRLGREAAAYHPAAMNQEMSRHHYGLQYHLYTLAVHRYLQLRLGAAYNYEHQFGGVFYVFLRGVDPRRPTLGVFRDRPSHESITRLEALFSRAV